MKITGKDLVSIGIFTLLMLAVATIAPILGVIPGMYLLRTPVVALLCGPVYLLFVARVKKPFCITIMGLICAGIMGILSFGSVTMFLINLTCFILADIIAGFGKYKSMVFNSASYIVLGFWTFAQDGAFWYMKDFMIEFTRNSGMGEEWLISTLKLFTSTNLIIVLVITMIASIMSVVFSKMIFKKHFKKAGLI